MKWLSGFLAVFASVSVWGANPPSANVDSVQIIEEIVAKVNGEIITRGDLEHAREQAEADLKARGLQGDKLKEAVDASEKDLLRTKIDEMLLVQRAAELDMKVDSDVTKQLAEYQLRAKIVDPDEFQRFVAEQSGMLFEDFKDQLKRNMLTRQVLGREVGSRIQVPREEVKAYYEKHKEQFVREEQIFLSEILISLENKTGDDLQKAEEKAKDLLERAKRGERFGELARDNSDAVTATDMGYLGGFKRGDLNPEIEKQVWDKGKGFVTELVKIPTGYLILRVEEQHEAGQATLEEVEQQITNALFNPRFEPRVREYLTELRERAFLQIREGYLDTGAAPGKNTAWQDPAELRPETVSKEEVAARFRKRRLLWLVPVPFTKVQVESSSSK